MALINKISYKVSGDYYKPKTASKPKVQGTQPTQQYYEPSLRSPVTVAPKPVISNPYTRGEVGIPGMAGWKIPAPPPPPVPVPTPRASMAPIPKPTKPAPLPTYAVPGWQSPVNIKAPTPYKQNNYTSQQYISGQVPLPGMGGYSIPAGAGNKDKLQQLNVYIDKLFGGSPAKTIAEKMPFIPFQIPNSDPYDSGGIAPNDWQVANVGTSGRQFGQPLMPPKPTPPATAVATPWAVANISTSGRMMGNPPMPALPSKPNQTIPAPFRSTTSLPARPALETRYEIQQAQQQIQNNLAQKAYAPGAIYNAYSQDPRYNEYAGTPQATVSAGGTIEDRFTRGNFLRNMTYNQRPTPNSPQGYFDTFVLNGRTYSVPNRMLSFAKDYPWETTTNWYAPPNDWVDRTQQWKESFDQGWQVNPMVDNSAYEPYVEGGAGGWGYGGGGYGGGGGSSHYNSNPNYIGYSSGNNASHRQNMLIWNI